MEPQPLSSQPGETPKPGSNLVYPVAICLALGLVFMATFGPGFYAGRSMGHLAGCKANLRSLSEALSRYAKAHDGRYPKNLEALVQQNYLKALPTCPAAKAWTYLDYHTATEPDGYSMSCAGDYHARAYRNHGSNSSNYPRCSSKNGLQEPGYKIKP